MIWGRREFLAQIEPQGLGWDLSTVLCTELPTKKRVTQWLVIHYVLGSERGVNSTSALPSAFTRFRRAGGWPGGTKLLLGRSSSRRRPLVLGWPLCQGIFYLLLPGCLADRLYGFLLNHFSSLWMNSETQAFSETETQQFLSSVKTYQREQRAV